MSNRIKALKEPTLEQKADAVQNALFNKAMGDRQEFGKMLESLVNAHALITMFKPEQIEQIMAQIQFDKTSEELLPAKQLVVRRLKRLIKAHPILSQI